MESNTAEFPWYGVVSADSGLEQGDFLEALPVVHQPLDMPTELVELRNGGIVADVELYNVVVMTQSCDFQRLEDTDLVTLCPRSNYSDLYGKSRWKQLRAGRVVGAHLLNKCSIPEFTFEYQIVNMVRVLSVPYGYVKQVAARRGRRVRLLSPYREHLSQAFARLYMRVGLPIDLPTDFPY